MVLSPLSPTPPFRGQGGGKHTVYCRRPGPAAAAEAGQNIASPSHRRDRSSVLLSSSSSSSVSCLQHARTHALHAPPFPAPRSPRKGKGAPHANTHEVKKTHTHTYSYIHKSKNGGQRKRETGESVLPHARPHAHSAPLLPHQNPTPEPRKVKQVKLLGLGLLAAGLALARVAPLGGGEDEALDRELHEEVEVRRVPVVGGVVVRVRGWDGGSVSRSVQGWLRSKRGSRENCGRGQATCTCVMTTVSVCACVCART